MSTAGQLEARMIEASRPMPVLCDVTGAYAQQVAVLSSKLTEDEVEILILLGGLIYRRTAAPAGLN